MLSPEPEKLVLNKKREVVASLIQIIEERTVNFNRTGPITALALIANQVVNVSLNLGLLQILFFNISFTKSR